MNFKVSTLLFGAVLLLCPSFAQSTPPADEPLIVNVLPKIKGAKPVKYGHVDFSVYRMYPGGDDVLLNEQRNLQFGDCPGCVRGFSLNCSTPKSLLAPRSPERKLCDNGLANGIGIRIDTVDNSQVLAIKNQSRYQLAINDSAQIQGANLRANTTEYLILSLPEAGGTASTPIYKIAITFKPSTGEFVDASSRLELIPFNLPPAASEGCKQVAGALAKAVMETSAAGYEVMQPFIVSEIKLKRTYTWSAAPRSGFAFYFVGIKSSDGWDCDFDVELGVSEKGKNAKCDFYSMRFRMCAK